eukprot:483054_1
MALLTDEKKQCTDNILTLQELKDNNIDIDDVSGLNKTKIGRLFIPRNENEIINILRLAIINNKQLSLIGCGHSMGGQVITPNGGYVLDMKYFNNIRQYNHNNNTIVVESGIKWDKMIKYLNRIKMSVDILQSYCSFSVGGSISVNAHGITSDYGIYKSIIGMNILIINRKLKVHKLYCTANNENKQLFSLIIGGYGIFGVILDVQFQCVPNALLIPKQIRCTPDTFLTQYETLLKDDTINIKLCRINIQTWKEIFLYVMHNKGNSSDKLVSNLSENALGMTFFNEMVYKWVAPSQTAQKLRFGVQNLKKAPMDMPNKEVTRNEILFQDATPYGQLYNRQLTVFKIDDTFILQEFFIPHKVFLIWYKQYARIIKTQLYDNNVYNKEIYLLNTTIRYLYKDTVTVLKYAKKK